MYIKTLKAMSVAMMLTTANTALAEPLLPKRTEVIAAQGYTYGFPILLLEQTFNLATGPVRVCELEADINTIVHLFERPDSDFRAVVRPNVDTLYSTAFLDLKNTAVLLDMPAVENRYVLMALFDAWTNNFSGFGTETYGENAAKFIITGPDWEGTVPEGYTRIEAPTNLVWIIGRTEVRDENDVAEVNEIQKSFKLTPLNTDGQQSGGNGDCIPQAEAEQPEDTIKGLSGVDFFTRLDQAIKKNPGPTIDDSILSKLGLIGVGPYANFDVKDMSPSNIAALSEGNQTAQSVLDKGINLAGSFAQWSPDPTQIQLGEYGDNYLVRATIAQIGFGANKNEYAVYQNASQDLDKNDLSGENSYTITFPPEGLPPVNAFWSMTVYTKDGFLVPNDLKRYALGSYSGLVKNEDGSVTLHLAHTKPAQAPEQNWLPIPQDTFEVTLRMYAPKEPILNGEWKAPAIIKK